MKFAQKFIMLFLLLCSDFCVASSQFQPVKKPEWTGNSPSWPPPQFSAPVPGDEVPIDSFELLLFTLGLILVYAFYQHQNGLTFKEMFSFKTLRSFRA